MLDAGKDVALGQFGQIEPGAEMIAFAGEHHGADIVRQRAEERLDAAHRRIVERVALFGARSSVSTATAPCRSAFKVGGRSANSAGLAVVASSAPFDPFRRGP